MARVVLKDLSKTYGNVKAVLSLNLECEDGEFLALLGPSGCGKTSTLRMVAGLESVTSGEIYIDGRLVNHLPPADRDVAMAFEAYALYPPLTVFNNIAFPLVARQYSKGEIRRRVENVAEVLQITDILNRKPAQLSGGQQQRVSLARALVRDAAVYLMDEPISHLDAVLRNRMRSELKRIHQTTGSTVIYVTHDQLEAMAMADRIAIMNLGVLQQVGTPQQVFRRPANEFVADFVGEPPMNFIAGTIVKRDGRVHFCWNGYELEIEREEVRKMIAGEAGKKARLGIRPTDITVYGSETPGGVSGGIYVTEPIGDSVILTVKIAKELLLVKVPVGFRGRVGEKVWLVFNQERLHIFDPKTSLAAC